MGNNRNPMSIYTKYIIILKRPSTNGNGGDGTRDFSIIQIVVKKERTHFCGRSQGQESLFKSEACRNETVFKAKYQLDITTKTDTKKF